MLGGDRTGTAADEPPPGQPTPGQQPTPTRVIAAEDLYDAIRQPAPAPWMAPPSQRVGYTLSAFSKFVP